MYVRVADSRGHQSPQQRMKGSILAGEFFSRTTENRTNTGVRPRKA